MQYPEGKSDTAIISRDIFQKESVHFPEKETAQGSFIGGYKSRYIWLPVE